MGAWWSTRDRTLLRDLAVRTDASPWSMAGILYLTGVPRSWGAQEIDENDLERMPATHGDSAWLPAFVMSFDLWRPLLARRAVAPVQTDASAASGVVRRLAGRTPAMSNLASELV